MIAEIVSSVIYSVMWY